MSRNLRAARARYKCQRCEGCRADRFSVYKRGMTYHFLLVLAGLFSLLVGCHPETERPHSDAQTRVSSDAFRIMTYNTLHGLEVGKFWVYYVESDAARADRFMLRVSQLAQAQPDVILLQEVNPLPDMAGHYVRALKERGLSYSQVHQVDACGLRLAPGLAVVPGLNNGLVILAKKPLTIRKLEGLKLSGSFGTCSDYAGVQFGELRYALLAEVTFPLTGLSYLVATMHLHSGIERDAVLLHNLMVAHNQGLLQHYDHLMSKLQQDQHRREMELHALVQSIRRHKLHEQYAGVIFGGDLNFEAGSPEYQEIERAGFTDTAQLAVGMPMWSTYDPETNELAGHEEESIPPEFLDAVAEETKSDRNEAVKVYRRAIKRARRIDFLFSMAFMSHACLTQELVGKPAGIGGRLGSDHYGLLNTYTYSRHPC